MKTLYKTGLAFMAAMALLTSCSDDDSSPNNDIDIPGTGSYIGAKVDGQAFETLSIQGMTTAAASKTGSGDQTYIVISAASQNTDSMVVTLVGITGEGTFEIGPDSQSFVAFTEGTQNTFHSSADCNGVTGEIKVTHYSDEKVEGTFKFVGGDEDCTGTVNVTNGVFRGVYVQ